MNKRELREQDIIHLLKRWKEGDRHYPAGLHENRRTTFLALLPSFHPHIKPSVKSGQAGPSASLHMSVPMQIALGALTVVILILGAYAGSTIYQNWDALVNYLQGVTPTASSSSPHPTEFYSPPSPEQATTTPPATGTPSPTLPPAVSTTLPPNSGAGATPQASPTNPGNHYGQTKTPRPKLNQKP